MKQHILVVEDEKSIQNIVRIYLENAGYLVTCLDDGIAGLAWAQQNQPDLVVLDLNLPSMDGLEVAARLRQVSDVYILMLTARGEEEDRILGLRLGADDYLAKPFSPRELVARVETILRRSRRGTPTLNEALRFAHLTINNTTHEATADGQLLDLTLTEFQLLWAMAQHAGLVLTRDQLIEQVWGANFYGNERVVDVYVGQVRRKLQDATGELLIQTVRGVGYKFADGKQA
jgi:two-component system alkaline phosphatase synthesis response regulator PhoP